MSDTHPVANCYPISSVTGTLEVVKRAAQDGAADARAAATRTWSATSLFLSRFVYSTCYSLSYGMVFPAMLVAQAIPRNNTAVRGLIDGAQAARQKVDQICSTTIETPNLVSVPATMTPA
jgi:hypothetical protein